VRNVDIKFIYNTYLRISRQKQNKPFKLRGNWDGFEQSKFYPELVKLKSFFDRNTVVNIEDYFVAPYEVYEEESFYDLNFYNSLSATKVYTIFCNKRNQLDPDNDQQVLFILRGLKFIKEYCIENNIKLKDYLHFKQTNHTINAFFLHLKEKNINIYNLFPLKDFDKVFSSIDYEAKRFILGDLPMKISFYRVKFYGSKKGRQIATKGLSLIEKEISKNHVDIFKKHNTI
jgi:hypothetical protein